MICQRLCRASRRPSEVDMRYPRCLTTWVVSAQSEDGGRKSDVRLGSCPLSPTDPIPLASGSDGGVVGSQI